MVLGLGLETSVLVLDVCLWALVLRVETLNFDLGLKTSSGLDPGLCFKALVLRFTLDLKTPDFSFAIHDLDLCFEAVVLGVYLSLENPRSSNVSS